MLAKKRNLLTLTLLIVVIIPMIFYFNFFNQKASGNEQPEMLLLSKDFPSTSELEVMKTEADIIVIGEYTGFDSKWNMARNPDDSSKEDNENYVEGHLYNFTISEIIKGKSESTTIKVNHRFAESVMLEDSSEGIKQEVINNDPLYIEPKMGKTYFLFLKYNPLFNNYYGAIEPFSILINEDNIAELQTNLSSINENKLETKVKIGKKDILLKNELHETISDQISGSSLEELKNQLVDPNNQ